MSFSWSAPRVTPEQETLERENLTMAEKAKLVDDIYGCSEQAMEENANMVRDAISDINMHLILIPPEEKEAYLEALERCPDLVTSESSCVTFLRAEHFNPEAAARRRVNYWAWRCNLFGELAFLPMTQQGALSNEVDRLTLSKGLVTVQGIDEHGRPVIHYDRGRMNEKAGPRNSILRVIFFIFHALTVGDERASKNGVVCLANFQQSDVYPNYDRILGKQSSHCVMEALPVQIKAVHLCLPVLAYSFLKVVVPVIKQIGGKQLRLRMTLHTKTGPSFLREMEPYGITIKNIPFALGGAFLDEDYIFWLREQETVRVRPPQPLELPEDILELARAA